MADISEQIEELINKILSKNAASMLEFLSGLSQEELLTVGLTKEDIINGDLNYILHQLHLSKLFINWQLNGIANGVRETGQSVEKVLKNPISLRFLDHGNLVTNVISNPAIAETNNFLCKCELIRGAVATSDKKLRMLASLELKTFGKEK